MTSCFHLSSAHASGHAALPVSTTCLNIPVFPRFWSSVITNQKQSSSVKAKLPQSEHRMLSRQARQKHLNDLRAGRSEVFWRLTWYKKTIIGIALKKRIKLCVHELPWCTCIHFVFNSI